ncbi:LacI family DNA-binding transcriptional regulator [Plantibacter sp. Leaf314]|uniref:LacI family DNA-binding transcriptional regulator n=1 Tax=Plantibacter sp. Leaf314 TaxID=1736333 RepID=UPI0006F28B0D|nr:LacI family DNA-binding transcriptional regulator [Plantibacter sp. Leaf314]KQQ49683.1 LacI family transcriptional regulator [Plantibacter sp. Leaf314]
MATTLHDVAKLAGVSAKTVSNVVNDYPHIKAATKERVLAAIAELGYRPNLSARGLRSGRSGVISLIVPDLRNAYFAELADAVMRAAARRGLSLLIEQSGGGLAREADLLRGARLRAVDGVLYSALQLSDDDLAVIEDVSIPMVLLGERIFNAPNDHVTMRNTEGARAATEHLLSIGCRRVVAFGAHRGDLVSSASLRFAGYRAALEAAGLPVAPELVRDVAVWHRFDGAVAMREMLDEGLRFDGIVAFNDALALGAIRVLAERGIRMPEEVAVIGFDDIDEGRYSLPSLSTIAPGREQIASTAVDLLVERIESADDDARPARRVYADFQLVQRESTTR